MTMTHDHIAARAKDILAELIERRPEELDDGAELAELGIDSLMFLEAFEQIKDEYDLTTDLNALRAHVRENPVRTLGDMIASLHRLVTAGRSPSVHAPA